MLDLIRPLITGFNQSDFAIKLQLSDISAEDAVRRARGDAGSSISWNVGHILGYRCAVLQACGEDEPNPYIEKYSVQSPATDGSDYPIPAELLAAWNDIHSRFSETLLGLSREELLAGSGLPMGDSLLGGLNFVLWHEASHCGMISLLRVQWGYRHTHELAIEAMQRAAK